MVDGRKVSLVDGYAVVRSLANRAAPTAPAPTPETPKSPRPPANPGRTVLPTRHDLLCYHCDMTFAVLGDQRFTLCPRCHQRLDIMHVTLDGPFDRSVRTAGRVLVKPDATVTGGLIKASEVRVEGRCEADAVEALRIEIGPGGILADRPGAWKCRELVVDAGAEFSPRTPVACARLNVAGLANASFMVEETARLRAGGRLEGTLDAVRLSVEDGAALAARLRIGPRPATEGDPPA